MKGMTIMEYEGILRVMAPCGLNCGACVAFRDGEIRKLSERLGALLGPNFGAYAARFAENNPMDGDYPAFRRFLDGLAQAACDGCRHGSCRFSSCGVQRCVREKHVDFCFRCDEFPCDHTGLPPALEARWRANNEAMRESGVAEYYEELKKRPRYP